ncbi:MAG: M23 family metallopeptidase [Gemmatimonadota bacterium]
MIEPRRDRGTLTVRLVLATGAGALGVFWLAASTLGGAAETAPVRQVVVPAPTPPVTVYDTLDSGETLAELLADNGFDPPATYDFTRVVREVKSPRRLQAGMVARFSGPPEEPPETVHLLVNPDSLIELAAGDEGWAARVHEVPVVVDTIRFAGLIDSSLWFATLSGDVDRMGENEFKEYVFHLADVFMWKVDFTRDIRRGDAFRVAVERERRPDGSVRERKFLVVELSTRGKLLQAIPFTRPDGSREYFDYEGDAMRGSFLRYPVDFRITSSFSSRRYHPVLKVRRAHLGTDYGAPYGTPVKATAAGTVSRAGTWGGYGRMVEVRHAKGISTRYAHLSSVGVRVGQPVDQGEVIGRVGATGLATGAHLHYEFLQGGRHRNPASIELPSAPALEQEYMEEFGVSRDRALGLLDRLALPALPTEETVIARVAD